MSDAKVCTWRSEGNFVTSVLSFYLYMGLGNLVQVLRLAQPIPYVPLPAEPSLQPLSQSFQWLHLWPKEKGGTQASPWPLRHLRDRAQVSHLHRGLSVVPAGL